MSLAQLAGQLIMVGTPAGSDPSEQVATELQDGVGSVILTGRSSLSVSRTAQVTAALRADALRSTGLLVATDQEGGEVQVLQGPGFSRMPSGVEQGRTDPAELESEAAGWGAQLHDAGVNLDLAPVLDTVPASNLSTNPPIAGYDREYGTDPTMVSSHGLAFLEGLRDAKVAASPKHFPGLGRVTANTDVSSGVRDTTTTRTDPYLQPYRDAIRDGTQFMMVSTAVYTRIDPLHPAAFSPTVVTGLLRHTLGFQGVVVTDDVGAAAQVAYLSPAQRAVEFVQAGGDLVLTVVADQVPAMTRALVAQAQASGSFAADLRASALRVLEAKQRLGLLG